MHTSSICAFYNHLPVLSEPAVISVLVGSEGTLEDDAGVY